MNKEDFISLAFHPKTIGNEQIIALESVLEEYPFFQAAQVLYLKGLKKQGSFKYNNTLKKVAATTTNRTVLFDFITLDSLDYTEKTLEEVSLLKNIEVVDEKIIEHLSLSIKTQEKEQTEKVSIKEQAKIIRIEEELQLGKPLEFDKNDSFSFNEWLTLSPKKEIIRDENHKKELKTPSLIKKNKNKSLDKQVNLIESFIAKKPKIKTDKNQEIKDIAVGSVEENTHLMTETLAKVYLEQKKYDKAKQAFSILSLKYPEKSSFFADKIKSIEFLQKNKS